MRRYHEGMVFADLKNDFVFRRIFATHPDLLRGLLNDLLERTGDQIIEAIEYLPSEQLPAVEGGKLSILDVRCRDRAGTTFVVEMQLIHHPGFVNRVIYNACKSYSGQLKSGEWYTKLMDVVAISICDFELWPDAQQEKQGLPPVPMLSRWNMTERTSKTEGLLQVQYAFLELPKLPDRRPEAAGADLWAWLFVHAPELTEMPEGLLTGPYRQALELANQAKFTQEELNTYERVRDEIRQVLEIAAERWAQGHTKGKAEGLAAGEAAGLVKAVLAVLAARGISVSPEVRAHVEACKDAATLDLWIARAATAASAEEVIASASPRG
jgi:predicted transposase/invertase (TIGR01784 family)